MNLLESVHAVATASGDHAVDWSAVATAAKAGTEPGSIELTAGEQDAYAADVRDARATIQSVSGVAFSVPDTIEIQNRHHWIDANVETFRRAFEPLDEQSKVLPAIASSLNTASVAGSLAFLARHVLGQYDPLLLADGDDDHGLYFVHPNIARAAVDLDVPFDRFRRWIAFHEVTHAAEFGAAPWLDDYLATRLRETVEQVADRRMPTDVLRELDLAMTAVEGFAELLMDRAFDEDYSDLRAKLDARRQGGGPVTKFVRRLIGLQLKRRQYERGRAFFDAVVDRRGIEGAAVVWKDPSYLPTSKELAEPERWLARVPVP